MRKCCLCLLVVTVLCGGCVAINTGKHAVAHDTDQAKPAQVLRHVVLFKFKDGTSAEDVQTIESAFCALPGRIDTIYDFEWGTDVSAEDLTDGFTHCFVVTFKDEAGRAVYLPHPAHEEFRGVLRPHLEKVLVVDYWTKE